MAEGFVAPDFSGDLQIEERLRGVSKTGHSKGFMLEGINKSAAGANVKLDRPSYVAWRNYPLTEYLDLLAEAATKVHPGVPPLEGLRRLGHGVYTTFVLSAVGRITMAVAGRDIHAAIRAAPRAYASTSKGARLEVISSTERSARLALMRTWDWPAAYHVGIFEGALDHYQVDGTVSVKETSLCEAELQLTWRPR